MQNKKLEIIDYKSGTKLQLDIYGDNNEELCFDIAYNNGGSAFGLDMNEAGVQKAERIVSFLNEWIKRFKNRAFE